MTTQLDPHLVEAAKRDQTLAYMIKKGIPLTRERWIKLHWLADPPQPWDVEHELEVPEPWRDLSKVEAEEEEELLPQQTPRRPSLL